MDEYKASMLGTKLETKWNIEVEKAKTTNRMPSLLKVLVQTFGAKFMLYGVILLFVETIIRMSQPLLIGGLLVHFNNGTDASELRYAYAYAVGLLLNIFSNILIFHYTQVEMYYCAMKVRVACSSLIYRKALRISKLSLGETTVGQVTNLLSNDVNKFDMAARLLHFLWIGPVVMTLVTIFLWQEIGVSAFFGILTFIAFIPLQGWLGKKSFGIRLKTAPKTDERIKLLNEIISGIKVIKMYTWERPFSSLIQYARKMELNQIRGATYITVIIQSFSVFHLRLTLFASFFSYALLGNNVAINKVFMAISYFSIIWTSMSVFFPQAIRVSADVLITIKRIQTYLLTDEKNKAKSLSLKSDRTSKTDRELCVFDGCTTEQVDINAFGILISNMSAKWIHNQSDNTLNNINLTARPGSLVAIIGPVGAGKSSLMQSILHELPPTEGSISVRGVVSYASQEPWLFNGSVRQNILFDSSIDDKRYKQVIEVCSLELDIKQLPYGDRTIVGERGVSLSGGQRARINLARAVYKQADIYLLDDPLSAVDAQVGNHLFEKCIKDYLKEKTCVLITHQIQHLTNVDHIVLMENANIVAEGSYQELQASGLDFTKFLGSTEESVNASQDKTYDTDEIDLDTFSVISNHDSIQNLSPKAEEAKPNAVQAEPNEVVESRSSGKVSRSVYYSYMSAGGNVCKLSVLMFICILTQVLCNLIDYWISYWAYLEDRPNANGPYNNIMWWSISRNSCISIYAILSISLLILILIRVVALASFFMKSSEILHNNMFKAIIRSTMQFFNTNSSGRILNRFTADVGTIDEVLLFPMLDVINIGLGVFGTIFLIGFVNIYLLIPTCIIGVLFYFVVCFFQPTSQGVKRLESISRSPMISYFNASLQGLTTIRAFGAEEMLTKEFDYHQDVHSSAWYMLLTSNEALGFYLNTISFVLLSVLTFSFLVGHDNGTYSAYFGLILTQVIQMTGALQWCTRQALELENNMTSVERVLEYTNIPQEAAFESPPDKKPPKEWPHNGKIEFQNFNLRYSPDTPCVLTDLNLTIKPMERIGIVGRTGAGKSSLIGALFRLAINEGNILIDDIEIHELGLHDLRSKISIIPQEPVLFSGSMRKNLDPFDEYPDHDLWRALEEVELRRTIEELPDGLNSVMSEGGSNFSVGQRQMVCLARSVLRSNKVIVLDEATANIDAQTSSLIQSTIKNKLGTCTILTIAHRLDTVMDSDRVLVMDAGKVVEFDHPHSLLKNKDGVFYKMVEHTGSATSGLLRDIAAKSFNTKNVETDP